MSRKRAQQLITLATVLALAAASPAALCGDQVGESKTPGSQLTVTAERPLPISRTTSPVGLAPQVPLIVGGAGLSLLRVLLWVVH